MTFRKEGRPQPLLDHMKIKNEASKINWVCFEIFRRIPLKKNIKKRWRFKMNPHNISIG